MEKRVIFTATQTAKTSRPSPWKRSPICRRSPSTPQTPPPSARNTSPEKRSATRRSSSTLAGQNTGTPKNTLKTIPISPKKPPSIFATATFDWWASTAITSTIRVAAPGRCTPFCWEQRSSSSNTCVTWNNFRKAATPSPPSRQRSKAPAPSPSVPTPNSELFLKHHKQRNHEHDPRNHCQRDLRRTIRPLTHHLTRTGIDGKMIDLVVVFIGADPGR